MANKLGVIMVDKICIIIGLDIVMEQLKDNNVVDPQCLIRFFSLVTFRKILARQAKGGFATDKV